MDGCVDARFYRQTTKVECNERSAAASVSKPAKGRKEEAVEDETYALHVVCVRLGCARDERSVGTEQRTRPIQSTVLRGAALQCAQVWKCDDGLNTGHKGGEAKNKDDGNESVRACFLRLPPDAVKEWRALIGSVVV
jgi:hypothetical protein